MQSGGLTVQIQAEPIHEIKCAGCGQMLDLRGLKPFTKIICPSCAAEKVVPCRFSNYVLLELLGTGGMGAVYRGIDPLLDRPVAVKVLLKSLRDKPELRDRFHREAKAAANIKHPNVTHIYAFGEEQGQPYIVMEFVAGRSLESMIEQNKHLDQAFVVNTGLQIADGLQAGTKIGLVHGDVKPENILFDADETAKLIDFGLASFVDEDAMEGTWGSPYYISPEKAQRQPADERSDIYSLGATLYHALCGRPPFDGETALEVVKARLNKPPRPVNQVRRDVNATVARVVMRMLNADLSKRYPNYASLIGDLQSALIEVGGARRPMTRNLKRASAGGVAPAKEYEAKPSPAPSRKQPTVRHPTERKITASQSSLKRTTGRLGKGRQAEKGMSGLAIGVIVLLVIALIVFLFVKLSGVAGARPSGSETVAPRPAVAGAQTPAGAKPTAASPEKVRESGLITFEDGKFVACRGYGGHGTVSVSDGGKTVRLAGSVWKAYPLRYTVQSATVLEFDFKSQKQGNLQGIAMASDPGAKTDRLFKLYGARDSGLAALPYDSSAPQVKHYVIPVGQYFTGPVMFILFANDDISPKQDAESTYSNLRVYNK